MRAAAKEIPALAPTATGIVRAGAGATALTRIDGGMAYG